MNSKNLDNPSQRGDNCIVGFGKHKSLTYLQLAETQSEYIKWIFEQDFFSTAYPTLYSYLCKRGLKPRHIKSEKSHREIQALFTQKSVMWGLLGWIFSDEKLNFEIEKTEFEDLSNADIAIDVRVTDDDGSRVDKLLGTNITNHTILVEIKPRVGNDYPDVLLQMRKQLYSYKMYNNYENRKITQVLVLKRYKGDIPIETVRKIFGDIEVVFLKELLSDDDDE